MKKEQIYLIPNSVEEAISMAKAHFADFRYLAGGTDVMVNKYQGNDTSSCLIDVSKLSNLIGIKKEEDYLRIGAMEILEELKFVEELRTEFPMLIEAALSVGAPLLRKSATIGGNVLCENRCLYYNQSEWWRESIGYCLKCDGDICIASGGKNACFSEFVSDTAPALIAMDAEIEWIDQNGTIRKKLEEIYTGDGVYPKNLPKEAIVLALYLPAKRSFQGDFQKLRQRESLEFTSLTTAVTIDSMQRLKIVLGGVDPMPVVYIGATSDNLDEIIQKITKKARSVDNDMYSRGYRKEMISVFLKQAFSTLQINSQVV